MNNTLIAALIGIIIGLGAGNFLIHPATSPHEEMSMTDEHAETGSMEMDHPMLEVSGVPAPTVAIAATADTKGGYSVHVTTENYRFTPELAGTAAVQGEGHAHLYVKGVKVARLYGEWAYIDGKAFKSGENKIEVTLNANDHSEWAVDGKHISASVTVMQ